LDPENVSRWSTLVEGDTAHASPFFRPEFSQAVGAVRPDSRVAIVESDRGRFGYFPFMRERWNVGFPIGGALDDFHGPIGASGLDLTAEEWLDAAQLRCFRYSHLPQSISCFARRGGVVAPSPFIDLREGYESYSRWLRANSSREIPLAEQKLRKAVREVGPV